MAVGASYVCDSYLMRGYFSLTFYIYYSGIFSFLQISFCSFRFRNGGFYFVFSLTFYIYYSEILFDFQILFCFCLTMRRQNLTFKVKFLLKIFLNFYFYRSFSEAEIKRSSLAPSKFETQLLRGAPNAALLQLLENLTKGAT